MSEDEIDIEAMGVVSTASGNFYYIHKAAIAELLAFISDTGNHVGENASLPEADKNHLLGQVYFVSRSIAALDRSLASHIDETNPSFLNEGHVELLRSLLEAVFGVGQYVGMNNPAFVDLRKKEGTGDARKQKLTKDVVTKRNRTDVLRSFIGGKRVDAYTKFIESNLDDINAAAEAAGAKPAGKSTWTNLLAEMGYGPQKSKAVRAGEKTQS